MKIGETVYFILLSLGLSFGYAPKAWALKETAVNVPLILKSNYVGWGLQPKIPSSINIESAWKSFKPKKKDLKVAIIDTGVDPTHPFIADNIIVLEGKKSVSNFGKDFSKNRKSINTPFDTHGHGTHIAGIIKSVFPKVKFLVLKYFDPAASGLENLNSTIQALKYAIDQNVDIINYSGGGPEPSAEELAQLKRAAQKGILIIAAAGNEESNIDDTAKGYYPASYRLPNIITVAAHNQELRLINSSNYGIQSVDLSAPGDRIKSSLPFARAGYLTGTSQATAFVSGVAALIKTQYPELSSKSIKEILKKSAKQEITLLTKLSSKGRLDATKAMVLAQKVNKALRQKRAVAAKYNHVAKEKRKMGSVIYRVAR